MQQRDEECARAQEEARASTKRIKDIARAKSDARIAAAIQAKELRLKQMQDAYYEKQDRPQKHQKEKHAQAIEDSEANKRRISGKNRRAQMKLAAVRKAEQDHRESIRQMHTAADNRLREMKKRK